MNPLDQHHILLDDKGDSYGVYRDYYDAVDAGERLNITVPAYQPTTAPVNNGNEEGA